MWNLKGGMKLNTLLLALFLLLAGGPAWAGDRQEKLFNAIERDGADNVEQVAEILNKGADANKPLARPFNGRTPLQAAIERRKLKVVKLLLDKGANVHIYIDWDPLLLAVSRRFGKAMDINEVAIAELLLEKGADVNARNLRGETALMWAAVLGNAWVVELLLAYGADKSLKNIEDEKEHETALDIAKRHHYSEIVKLLESDTPMKIDPAAARQREFVAAITYGADAKQVAKLLSAGAGANKPDKYGRLPLTEAVFAGDPEVVQLLLEKGADANAKNFYGDPAVMVAADVNSPEAIKLLAQKGADLNAKTRKGQTALMKAAHEKHAEIVQLLLDKGADPNAQDQDGETALMKAADANIGLQDNRDTIKLLVDKGADVNAKDSQGVTVLMRAIPDAEVVEAMLKRGADRNAKDNDGRTALDIAKAMKYHPDIVALLEGKAKPAPLPLAPGK